MNKIITPTPTLKNLVAEVRREVKMRLKVWQTADRKNHRFVNQVHQYQFDHLVQVGCILSVMTPEEYFMLQRRYQEINTPAPELFNPGSESKEPTNSK